MVDLEKVRFPSPDTIHSDRSTNTVVALDSAEIEVNLKLQVWARLTKRVELSRGSFLQNHLLSK